MIVIRQQVTESQWVWIRILIGTFLETALGLSAVCFTSRQRGWHQLWDISCAEPGEKLQQIAKVKFTKRDLFFFFLLLILNKDFIAQSQRLLFFFYCSSSSCVLSNCSSRSLLSAYIATLSIDWLPHSKSNWKQFRPGMKEEKLRVPVFNLRITLTFWK